MIKKFIHTILYFILGLTIQAQKITKQPNIILILADDLGWADLTCYGSTFYETPNIDKLATEGILFTNAYSASTVCSPTRASILTGKYPVRTGITDWIKGRQENGKATAFEKLITLPFTYYLQPEEETIAEVAINHKYKTFFAGKWHLGEAEANWPEHHGFTINKGGIGKGSPASYKNDSTGAFFTPYNNPRLADGPKGEYLTNRLTDECLSYLEANKDSTFFIMFALYAVHNPLQAPKELIEKYQAKKKVLNIPDSARFRKDESWMQFEKGWKQRLVQDNAVYAAMVQNMDENIGRLLSKLKSLGLSDNTIVVFTSDNGGLSTAEGSPTHNGKLKAGKGWLYEGGIRVPLIIKWPTLLNANAVSTIPVSTVDIYTTLYKAMSNKAVNNKVVDGKEIRALLANEQKSMKRPIYWHYPHYSNQGGKPSSAILKNGYKLIANYEDNTYELYNLKLDVSETTNLITTNKKIYLEYKKLLHTWLAKNKAKYALPNPLYNPYLYKEIKE